jgi:hypothetical protein
MEGREVNRSGSATKTDDRSNNIQKDILLANKTSSNHEGMGKIIIPTTTNNINGSKESLQFTSLKFELISSYLRLAIIEVAVLCFLSSIFDKAVAL